MKKLTKPTGYNGILQIPPSKSSMQRAVAMAILAEGETILNNPDYSNDSKAALSVAKNLGAKIEEKDAKVHIFPNKYPAKNSFSVGESGLGIRMFSPLAALFEHEITINGEGSLKKRPLSMLKEPLENLGATVQLNNKYLPVKIKGKLIGGSTFVDGSTSSQFLTGLLISLPKVKNDSVLDVKDLKSKPYIDLTINMLKKFDVSIDNYNYKTFKIKGNQQFKACEYQVESDWSSASFHIVGAAISGEITLTGLDLNSKQADRAILKAVEKFGAIIEQRAHLSIKKNKNIAFEFDATECPDLFPPLAVLATAANGTSKIKGVSRLTHKESNRALVLQNEFGKLGVQIDLVGDYMHIKACKPSGGIIHSNHDHRIAMAGTIMSLISSGEISIEEPDAVKKSYPDFYKHFESITKL